MSEQIILTDPRVSTAGNFLTMALILLILVTPRARTMATIAGRPSGMAATAKLIESRSMSTNPLP